MRYINDALAQECALLDVTLTIRGGTGSMVVRAVAVAGDWSAAPSPNHDGTLSDRFRVVHTPSGLFVGPTLCERDAVRVVAKLRAVHVDADCYRTIRAAFPKHARDGMPDILPLSTYGVAWTEKSHGA